MNQGLGRDHPVEQLAPGIARGLDNGPIGVGRRIVERQCRQDFQDGVQPWPPQVRLGRIAIDAAFQFDAADDGQKDGAGRSTTLPIMVLSPSRIWMATLVSRM